MPPLQLTLQSMAFISSYLEQVPSQNDKASFGSVLIALRETVDSYTIKLNYHCIHYHTDIQIQYGVCVCVSYQGIFIWKINLNSFTIMLCREFEAASFHCFDLNETHFVFSMYAVFAL